jgi:hypothetical protein
VRAFAHSSVNTAAKRGIFHRVVGLATVFVPWFCNRHSGVFGCIGVDRFRSMGLSADQITANNMDATRINDLMRIILLPLWTGPSKC